jgi:energy-coupling factor transporter ATP-binding protein EcfA2
MQQVKRLSLNNFKFFYGENQIDFEKKNTLIYGENGSGKSSIYWALYTFLQSVYKSDEEIKKYFDSGNEQNLINRFIAPGTTSSIAIEFEDEHEASITKKISLATVNTKGDDFLKVVSQCSDFINYKLLSKVYDFSNREQIDLFPIFESEILTYVSLDSEFIAGNRNANDWWQYIKKGLNPRPKMHEKEYVDFQNTIYTFNNEIQTFLNKIVEGANEYLQKKFKQKLKIQFEYHNATYDAFLPNSRTRRNHIIIKPKIILSVEYLHDSLVTKGINRPHSFLNEAKLTTIALAIRFAVLDDKYIRDSTKLLVLDDLLISLDMSNRDIVLELILHQFQSYQIVILTHDRSFFNLIKKRLDYESLLDRWIIKEMYQDENGDGVPIPFIPNNSDYLEKAEKYLREFDYPACANYLRKETERLLKHLLPYNKTVKTTDEEGTKALQLDTLIDNFKKIYVEYGGDYEDFKKLKEYKDILLNPLSHDNLDAPIYKLELLELKITILKLRCLESKILVSIKEDPKEYLVLTETANDGEIYEYKVQLKEYLKAFKTLDGNWSLSNPKCLFLKRRRKSDMVVEELNMEFKLNRGYEMIKHALEINRNSSLLDLVTSKGITLRNLF